MKHPHTVQASNKVTGKDALSYQALTKSRAPHTQYIDFLCADKKHLCCSTTFGDPKPPGVSMTN